MTYSITRRGLGRALVLAAGFAALGAGAALAAGEKIAVITPYLSQPGTQFYVEAFEARAKELGWEVNVIDTQGDVAYLGDFYDVAVAAANTTIRVIRPSSEPLPAVGAACFLSGDDDAVAWLAD
jgi:ABC-type sugar transport system substrate-binding protein